jgi:ABC-type uncharacterized transport system YnjBCD substrate-binding protein
VDESFAKAVGSNATMTVRVLGVLVAAAALFAGCSGAGGGGTIAARTAPGGSWHRVVERARGQTVNWCMYGGDDRVNAYVRRAGFVRFA